MTRFDDLTKTDRLTWFQKAKTEIYPEYGSERLSGIQWEKTIDRAKGLYMQFKQQESN